MEINNAALVLVRLLTPVLLATLAGAQAGWVRSDQKISQTEGGFTGDLADWDIFGRSVAAIGDLDSDGVGDLAVGAPLTDDGGEDRGAVWVLFLHADGTVKTQQKISQTAGGFSGVLQDSGWFGAAIAALGDLDGDGVTDLAVSSPYESTVDYEQGAVWILFMKPNGVVKGHHKIDPTSGLFGYFLGGEALAGLGDLDGDGVVDLAVGAPRYTDPGNYYNRGAVWILFLDTDGTVKSTARIGDAPGAVGGQLESSDFFGASVASLGDFNHDGVVDLAVGSWGDDTGGIDHGAVWILFLQPDGTDFWAQKIATGLGGFTGELGAQYDFGTAVAPVGDLDGDGILDLAVGAPGERGLYGGDFMEMRGAVWILFLEPLGTVRAHQKISELAGGFGGRVDNNDGFGRSLAYSATGFGDLVAGVPYDDDGGANHHANRGALWILDLQDCPSASASFRNPSVGGTTNPAVYGVLAPPTLDGDLVVTVGTTGKLGCFLFAYATPLTLGTSLGNLLVDVTNPGGELSGRPIAFGDPALIALPIPDDPALCGFTCATQAVRFGGGVDLTNAQDLVLGR